MTDQLPDFESSIDALPIHLANFEGPLDLLLHLIKTNELNIYDIPIALITQQSGSGNAFFPSKLLATLAHSRPVVTVADDESALLAEATVTFLPLAPQIVDTIMKDYPDLRGFFDTYNA